MRTKESKNDKRTKLPNGIVIDIYGFLVSMDLSFLMIKQFSFVMGGVCVWCVIFHGLEIKGSLNSFVDKPNCL